MKKGDLLWVAVLGLFIYLMLGTPVHHLLAEHPYIGGFVKFFVLATMGEMLAIRIATKDWKLPTGAIYKALIWGFLGMGITLFFNIFQNGVEGAIKNGLLPGGNSRLIIAFFTSAAANLTFGPMMMAFHRVTDTYIDMKHEKQSDGVTIDKVLNKIDWKGFISFVVLKTIPMFWIPAHTLTFSLPAEYRVFSAAILSIALGAILASAKK